MPPSPPHSKYPSDPDPALEAVRTADDPAFERGRHTAIDLLEPANATVLAFWLQVVGDGTPLPQARHDPAEQVLYHQVANVAGYHDKATADDIATLSRWLYAHHLGIWTVHDDPSKTPEEIFRESVTALTPTTQQQFSAVPEKAQYPAETSFEACHKRAQALLKADPTFFWLQVVTVPDGSPTVYIDRDLIDHSPAHSGDRSSSGITIDSDADGDTDPDEPSIMLGRQDIDYVIGRPTALGMQHYELLITQLLTQHQFVAARTADESIDALGRQAVDLALENEYIGEQPSSL
jgi:hypothetical protein